MKSFWISEAFFLLSVVKLQAISVAEFCCPNRSLSVTTDDKLKLYIDGIEINDLPNANKLTTPDVVDFPCTTRLIAIHGINIGVWGPAGILASTTDDYVLTNSTWKCSNFSHFGWEKIGFDDSAWISALVQGLNGESRWNFMPGISKYAAWIWLRTATGNELNVYCRKTLDYDCCCYATNGGKKCDAGSESTDNYKTVAVIIGTFFGVSVCANIALLYALYDLRSQRNTAKYDGMEEPRHEGEGEANRHVYQNNGASGDETLNPARYEYPNS